MRPDFPCIEACVADELDVLRQGAFRRTPILIMLFAIVQQIVAIRQIELNLIGSVALIRDGHVVALPDVVVFDKTVLRFAPKFDAVAVSRRVIQHTAADVANVAIADGDAMGVAAAETMAALLVMESFMM